SAAKKLTSIHMHGFEQDKDDRTEVSRRKFIAKFPTKFKKSQFENIDEDGVVKPGTAVVQPGDPLILGVRKKELTSSDAMLGKLHKALKTPFIPHSTDWDHHQEGMVTDVVKGKGGVRVFVKSKAELEVGDKLSGRHGNKGVVSKVLPDSQMPQTKDGNPLEVLLNPLGVVGRINPAQVYETNLGKVVEKTGQPYRLEAFKGGDMVKFTERELKKNGISDTEDLIDPLTGREIPQVMTGTQHMLKLHKTSGSGFSAREVARYTADMRPA
ncbi:MAG: hypothetical protein GTO54_02705, partial [Nitrososphaeria archaeon]|nr:hypothetical protein [Nitrososphaeria archaeon]